MAKVINIRPHAVEVPLPLGGVATVMPNEALETSDEHAKSLLEQKINWQAEKQEAKKPEPKEDK